MVTEYFGRTSLVLEDLYLLKNKTKDKKFKLWKMILTEWRAIGNRLGIENGVLDSIAQDTSQTEAKLRKVLAKWFENAGALPNSDEYPLTFRGLHTLLEDIDKAEVAKQYFEFLDEMA